MVSAPHPQQILLVRMKRCVAFFPHETRRGCRRTRPPKVVGQIVRSSHAVADLPDDRQIGSRAWPHAGRCTRLCSDRRPRRRRARHPMSVPGGLGGDGPVVRLRAVRVAHAVRGLEVVLPHQPAHPLLGRADSLGCARFPVPFAMKRRRLERDGRPGSGAAPTGPRRQGERRIHAGAGAVTRTPYARRVEIAWAGSAGPKGRPPPTGPPS